KYDKSQITDIVKVDGNSVMFPLASFVYPVFVNLDIAKASGVDKLPTTRTEFADTARRLQRQRQNPAILVFRGVGHLLRGFSEF
ncbi:hypothetical protein ACC758_39070, partial [Rhizobium ruizarguesonis]